MISRRLLVAGVAAVASGRVTRSHAQPRPLVLHIPVSLVRDHPLVSVTVDGKGPFRLLLDSGNSSATSLSTERAKQAGLRSTGRVASIAGVVGAGERPIFLGRNVVIGGAVLQKDVAFVGDARTGQLLDGLLPAHVLTTKESELDFAAGEVRLYLEGAPDRDGFTPLSWSGDGRQMLVESYVDGLRAQLQVDTGASCAVLLSPRFVARNRLWRRYPRWISDRVMGVTGGVTTRQVRGSAVLFGRQNFNGPILTLTDPSARSYMDADGLIGMDLLRRYTLAFEPRRRRLWIKPNALLRDPYRYDRAGFDAILAGETALVTSVDAESPALKAGLKVGDRLDGITETEALQALLWRSTNEAGQRLDLDVRRGEERLTLKMTLEERI